MRDLAVFSITALYRERYVKGRCYEVGEAGLSMLRSVRLELASAGRTAKSSFPNTEGWLIPISTSLSYTGHWLFARPNDIAMGVEPVTILDQLFIG